MKLQEQVDAAMARALENGFDMADLDDPELIACDLMDSDADFGGGDFLAIADCCRDWIKRQRR
jgi:hypothetical protein